MENLNRFKEDPNSIAAYVRTQWLENIRAGEKTMSEIVIPFLEDEAIKRFKPEAIYTKQEPDKRENPERWRLFWYNEVRHFCHQFEPVGEAAPGQSPVVQAAINVFMAASELRYALETEKVEEVGVLSMLLVCEALNGGFSLDFQEAVTNGHIVARKAAPFLVKQGKKKKDPKTLLYEHYAAKHPRNNKNAVKELRDACPTVDDGASPFYWSGRTLIDRKTGKLILVDDMTAQLQKARERMKNRARPKL